MSRRTCLATASMLLLCTAGMSAWWIHAELTTPYYGGGEPETFAEIPRRAATAGIAEILAEAGVIRHPLPFVLYIRWTGEGRQLRAGEYRFTQPATPIEVARRLIKGDVFLLTVTIPEGLDSREVLEVVREAGLGGGAQVDDALGRVDWIRDLAPDAASLEGYLFPDTYRFPRRAALLEVLKAMVERFRNRFGALRQQTPLPERWTIHQIVTLASLIEKEVRVPAERPLVASVLVNRLDVRMPLGCDPTVIYALKLHGIWDGNIRKSDLSLESPYNTYVNTGLPPGPIANPGADSLKAALSPALTDYLYFVARNDGTHVFSKDYRSHQLAVNRFQKRSAR